MAKQTQDIARFVAHLRENWSVQLPSCLDQRADLHADIGADSLEILELLMIIESMSAADSGDLARPPRLATLDDAFNYYMSLVEQI
jgi:hypothetical protein